MRVRIEVMYFNVTRSLTSSFRCYFKFISSYQCEVEINANYRLCIEVIAFRHCAVDVNGHNNVTITNIKVF